MDLSFPEGLVVLASGGEIRWRRVEALSRAADLFVGICELLEEAGLKREDLGALGVGRGPGAFTGVRVAVTAAKFLAWALSLPLVAPTSLEVMAMSWRGDGLVCPCMDARRKEFYFGLFRKDGDRLEVLEGPLLGSGEEVREKLSEWSKAHGRGFILMGNARGVEGEGLDLERSIRLDGPSPEGLMGAVRLHLDAGALVSPLELLPLYLRRPDAVEKGG